MTPDNPEWGTEGGKDTYDYVYLLSAQETLQYFGDNEFVDDEIGYRNERSYTQPTDYTKSIGVWNGVYPAKWDYPNCTYWLRTPGMGTNWAAYINSTGTLMMGMSSYVTGWLSIRPCMWIDLSTAEIQ